MNVGIAGTLESNDAILTVKPFQGRKIVVKSIVDAFYHDQIERVIRETLEKRNITDVFVTCEDKGALDYTIRARLLAALARMEDRHA